MSMVSENTHRRIRIIVIAITLVAIMVLAPILLVLISQAVCGLCPYYSLSSLLTYAGSCLIGFGTIILSVLTFENNRRWESEKDHFERVNARRPFLIISKVVASGETVVPDEGGRYQFSLNELHSIDLEIRNVGDGPACNIRTHDVSAFGTAPASMESRTCLVPNDVAHFSVSCRGIWEKGERDVCFTYENILGVQFQQSCRVTIRGEQEYSSEQIEVDEGVFAPEITGVHYSLLVTSLSSQEECEQSE